MAYDIGPKIGIDGEAEFRKQLNNINTSLKTLDTELKKVTSEFQENAEGQDALTAKNKVLNKSLEQQQAKLKEVEKALAAARENYGENSTQAMKWEQVLNRTEATINNLEAEIRKNDKALDEMAQGMRDATTGAKKLDGAIDGLDATKLQKTATAAKNLSEKLSGVSRAAAGLGAAIMGTVPATQELRRDMSFLEQNAQQVGANMGDVTESFKVFNSVSGETDSAIEGVSNLLQAGFTESDLELAINGLAGAATRFPDTLKIEGLADGLQETLATGSAIGPFAELLDRLGIGAENFNAELAKCNTTAEKHDLVLKTLANAGLMDTYDAWSKNNKELVDYENSMLGLQMALSRLATTVAPLMSKVVNAAAGMIEAFNNLPGAVKATLGVITALTAVTAPLLGIVGNISTGIQTLVPILSKAGVALKGASLAIAGVSIPITAVVAGVGALIAVFAALWTSNEDFRKNVTLLWAQVKAVFSSVLSQIQEIVSSFIEVVSILWDMFGTEIVSVITGAMNIIKPIITATLNAVKGALSLIIALLNGDWSAAWESAKTIVDSMLNAIKGIVNGAFNTIAVIIRGVKGTISNAVKTAFSGGIDFIKSLPAKAVTWGKDFVDGLIKGIDSKIKALVEKVKSLAEKIKRLLHFSRPDEGPLREYETWMPDFMKGLAKGIQQNTHLVESAARNVADKMNFSGALDKATITAQAQFTASIDYNKLASAVGINGVYLDSRLVGRAMKASGVNFT